MHPIINKWLDEIADYENKFGFGSLEAVHQPINRKDKHMEKLNPCPNCGTRTPPSLGFYRSINNGFGIDILRCNQCNFSTQDKISTGSTYKLIQSAQDAWNTAPVRHDPTSKDYPPKRYL